MRSISKNSITEFLVLKEGLNYCGTFNQTLFIHQNFQEIPLKRCFAQFNRQMFSRGHISIDDLKYMYLVIQLRSLIRVFFQDLYKDNRFFATHLIMDCLRVLVPLIVFKDEVWEDFDDEMEGEFTEEFFLIPGGLFEVSVKDFIENWVFDCPATSDCDREDFHIDFMRDKLPTILKEVKPDNLRTVESLNQFLIDLSFPIRDAAFDYYYRHLLKHHSKVVYGLIGGIPFTHFLQGAISKAEGYIHPLQPFRLIQRPFLKVREQVLIVMLRVSSKSLYFLYRNFFEYDTSLGIFYSDYVLKVLCVFQYEVIALDDSLSEDENFIVPDSYPEISTEAFLKALIL